MKPLRCLLAFLALLWFIVAGVLVAMTVVDQYGRLQTTANPDGRLGLLLAAASTWVVLSLIWCLPVVAASTLSLALRAFDEPAVQD